VSGARPGRAARAWLVVVACGIGLGPVSGCSPPPQPDVLLVTIDTLRADWVHVYGFSAESSPRIDALARRGVVFENAIAAASLTAPAHASIMTSRYVREHSIGPLNGETRLDGVETVAERFRAAGYDTAAFVSNVVLRRRSGLDRGFDHYDDELEAGELNRKAYFERVAADTAGRAIEWLRGRQGRPVFLWLHLQDPHGPYTPPEAYVGRIGPVPLRLSHPLAVLDANVGRAGIPAYQALGEERDPALYAGRYGEELLYADHWVGEVVDAVEEHAGARGSVVLLTADHGESMGELGWFFQHGHATTPDLAHVPFIVVAPGARPGRIPTLVSHVDVAPTLLELAGLEGLEGSSGRSLAVVVRTGELPEERAVFSDTDGEAGLYEPGRLTRIGGALASRRSAAAARPTQIQALEWDDSSGPWRVAEADPNAVQVLLRYLEESAPLVAAEAMRPEHVEQLRALGYLPPDASDDDAPRDGEAGQRAPGSERGAESGRASSGARDGAD
jgi:arylsulfatase A-like enzyme